MNETSKNKTAAASAGIKLVNAEKAHTANDIIRFLAGEIMNETSDTDNTAERMQNFFLKRDNLFYYATIILDYTEQLEKTINNILAGKRGQE